MFDKSERARPLATKVIGWSALAAALATAAVPLTANAQNREGHRAAPQSHQSSQNRGEAFRYRGSQSRIENNRRDNNHRIENNRRDEAARNNSQHRDNNSWRDNARHDNTGRNKDQRWKDVRNRDHNNNSNWSNRNDRRWDRDWRNNSRYNWQAYRSHNRNAYRVGRYSAPYRNYSYRRVGIGFRLNTLFYGNRYWINDPWQYRLPDVYGPYRWVRYYDDVLLVNVYTGEVVDAIQDFFW